MKSSRPVLTAVAITLAGAAIAAAAHVDFKDPRRALGREGNIRIDAELAQETLSTNSPVSITYQIQNLSNATIAVADKICDTDFDPDSQTLTLSIGAEIPPSGALPHLVTISPGEKRVLNGGALVHVTLPAVRGPFAAVPRYVQVKVTVLRDIKAFAALIEQQIHSAAPVALPNSMFDRWVEASDSVLLNTIPVYWRGESRRGTAESDQPGMD